ncbi:unnamed protein product [Cuscuta campestris]|uniref:Protein transport protein SEC23 n=1 Tax=Cuscuta campestris TaxID=132261 RepID=A0A484K2T7_9ASTE|nr:unnamed protein product [Cuscuta campestris]
MQVGFLFIHGDATAKANLYKDRFLMLFQRLSRDSQFSKPCFGSTMSEYGSCKYAPIISPLTAVSYIFVLLQLSCAHAYLLLDLQQWNHFPANYQSISETNVPAELFPQYNTIEYESAPEKEEIKVLLTLLVIDTCLIEEEIGFLKSSLLQVELAELKVTVEKIGGLVVLAESFGHKVFKDSLRQVFQPGEDDLGLSSKSTIH